MTITIVIRTDNQAFADDPVGERAALIQGAARRIANGDREGSIRDSNGNTCGSFKVTGK